MRVLLATQTKREMAVKPLTRGRRRVAVTRTSDAARNLAAVFVLGGGFVIAFSACSNGPETAGADEGGSAGESGPGGEATLRARGVTVKGFEIVVIDTSLRHLADCP